jgi:hypothetical protein
VKAENCCRPPSSPALHRPSVTGMAVSRTQNIPGFVPPTPEESRAIIERANEEDLRPKAAHRFRFRTGEKERPLCRHWRCEPRSVNSISGVVRWFSVFPQGRDIGHWKMTPIQSYRFGPATKKVEHSSRRQSSPRSMARNRKEKKESASQTKKTPSQPCRIFPLDAHFGKG